MKKLFLLAVTAMLAIGCSSDDGTTPTNPGSENPGTENPQNPQNPQNPENPGELGCENAFFGNVELASQAQVDEFASHQYCAVYGTLSIGSFGYTNDITDISALFSVREITGYLKITGTQLTNLQGLENVLKVGNLAVHYNYLLQSIEQLSSLSEIGSFLQNKGQLYFEFNKQLTSLKGLDNVVEIYEFRVRLCPIENLEGLTNLKKASIFDLSSNDKLVNFNGLNNIEEIGYLSLYYNNLLESITELNTLKKVSEFVSSGNAALATLPLMSQITEMKTLWVGGMPIVSFDSFPNVTEISEVVIVDNDYLVTLSGLRNLKTLSYLRVSGCLSLTSLFAFTSIKSFIPDSHADFEGLHIYETGITSLSGLENITSFNGDIKINFNLELTDFCNIEEIVSQSSQYMVQDNAYNPTKEDILAGNCSQ